MMNSHRKKAVRSGAIEAVLCPALVLAVLAGVAWHWVADATEDRSEAFHSQAAEVINAIPYQIGTWRGTDADPPREAIALLRPNALAGRRYVDSETGRHVVFLVIQCRDARDMRGHYPPSCYPQSGWTIAGAEAQFWSNGVRDIPGMYYTLERNGVESVNHLYIHNFLIMPGGRFVNDMPAVTRIAGHQRQRRYGAAQIQIIYSEDVPPSQRDEITRMLLEVNQNVIEVLGMGV